MEMKIKKIMGFVKNIALNFLFTLHELVYKIGLIQSKVLACILPLDGHNVGKRAVTPVLVCPYKPITDHNSLKY